MQMQVFLLIFFNKFSDVLVVDEYHRKLDTFKQSTKENKFFLYNIKESNLTGYKNKSNFKSPENTNSKIKIIGFSIGFQTFLVTEKICRFVKTKKD